MYLICMLKYILYRVLKLHPNCKQAAISFPSRTIRPLILHIKSHIMSHHILLLGGHGKIAQLLTPMLLSRSWSVTSLIRNPDQVEAITKLGKDQPGKLNIVVSSLEEVKKEEDAKKILDEVKPDWVVWSAGKSLFLASS